jgi:hypothetical protein
VAEPIPACPVISRHPPGKPRAMVAEVVEAFARSLAR